MIFNLDSLHYVARRPVWALAWRDRLRGMIGRRFEPEGIDAMIFPRCNAIHTMWMSIPIDVVFYCCSYYLYLLIILSSIYFC